MSVTDICTPIYYCQRDMPVSMSTAALLQNLGNDVGLREILSVIDRKHGDSAQNGNEVGKLCKYYYIPLAGHITNPRFK